MTLIDFTLLDPEPLRLTLHRSEGGYYSVTDQNGRLFTPPSTNVAFHVRFMTAMAAKRDAVIDAASVEAFSVKVPQGSLAPGGFAEPAGRALSRRTEGVSAPEAGAGDSSGECGADGVPSPDSTSNVIPIREGVA